MPRRDYDDDELPRRPRRRRLDEDEDDRPRARSRSRFADDDYDDDEYDRPVRRKSGNSSNTAVVVLAVILGFLLVGGLLVGGYFAFRPKKATPQQQQQNFAGMQPQPQVNQPVFVPPGVPAAVIPPEVALECTLSNLRLENNGFGGRNGLVFDYEFPGGRPFGGEQFVAVVTEPGKQPTTARLIGFLGAKDTIRLDQFGGFGNFARGTQVYLGKGFSGPGTPLPKRISNVLTLN
jgi:hypothetical protein